MTLLPDTLKFFVEKKFEKLCTVKASHIFFFNKKIGIFETLTSENLTNVN